jgi:hypothetical protein
MPTGTQYYQALGHSLDDMAEYDAGGGSGVNTAVLIGLASADAQFSTTPYNARWIYNSGKIQQRRVRRNSYVPSTGTLSLDPTWTVPTGGDRCVLTSLFPVGDPVFVSDTSYFWIMNRALGMLRAQRRLSLTITSGAWNWSLAAYASWMNEARFGWPALPDETPQPRILEPGPGGRPIPADWRIPHLRMDGPNPYLEIEKPFRVGASGTLFVNVYPPASTFISGVESTTGITNETQTALPSVEDVVKVGRWIAAELLAARGASTSSGPWASQVAPLREIARSAYGYDVTAERSMPARPVTQGAA